MILSNKKNIICSVLIPTRNRPGALYKTVKMLMDQCNDNETVELLFRFDEDDENGKSMIDVLLDRYDNVIVSVGPRPPGGYGGLHELYNELYNHSSGKYVWIYGDDIHYLKSEDWCWDDVLREHVNKPCVIMPAYDRINPASKGNFFPIIHRDLVEWYGALAIHPSVDAQWEFFSRPNDLELYENRITLKHGMGCESEHIKDNLPKTNPRKIFEHKDELRISGRRFKKERL